MGGERDTQGERSSKREREREHCLLAYLRSLSLPLSQEKIKEDTHTHIQRQTSKQERKRERIREARRKSKKVFSVVNK